MEIKNNVRRARTMSRNGMSRSSASDMAGLEYNTPFGGIAPAAEPMFMVYGDAEGLMWSVVNGEIVYYEPYEIIGRDTSVDPNERGICTSRVCSTGYVKALIQGQSVEGGDLLILDAAADSADDMYVECPDVFQSPSFEVLGCESGNADGSPATACNPLAACANTGVVPGGCYTGFEARRFEATIPNPGNTLIVSFLNADDFIRLRLAVYCKDTAIVFKESIHRI